MGREVGRGSPDESPVGSQNSVQFTDRKETGILAEGEAASDTVERPFHDGCHRNGKADSSV